MIPLELFNLEGGISIEVVAEEVNSDELAANEPLSTSYLYEVVSTTVPMCRKRDSHVS